MWAMEVNNYYYYYYYYYHHHHHRSNAPKWDYMRWARGEGI